MYFFVQVPVFFAVSGTRNPEDRIRTCPVSCYRKTATLLLGIVFVVYRDVRRAFSDDPFFLCFLPRTENTEVQEASCPDLHSSDGAAVFDKRVPHTK